MKMNNFKDEFRSKKQEINTKLNRVFNEDNILQKGSNYSLMNNGKRIRPILFIEFYKLFKKLDEACYDFAIGIELIHNYSLVHDDLPAMDNDELRRGFPTTHIKYGEDMGILIGDGLLNKSMEKILNSISKADNKNNFIEGAKYLYSQSGHDGMILGQVLDIQNKLESKEDFLNMYDKKTCGLIKASCKCASLCANACENEVYLSEKFGYNLGLAFQLRDDLLDFEEDKRSGRLSYATLINDKDKVSQMVLYHSEQAIKCLVELKKDTKFLENMTKELINRDI